MSIYTLPARVAANMAQNPISDDQKKLKLKLIQDIKISSQTGFIAAQTAVAAPLTLIPSGLLFGVGSVFGPLGTLYVLPDAVDCFKEAKGYLIENYKTNLLELRKTDQQLLSDRALALSALTGIFAGIFFHNGSLLENTAKRVDNRRISDARFWMSFWFNACSKYCFIAGSYSFAAAFAVNFIKAQKKPLQAREVQVEEKLERSNLFYKLANPRLTTSEITKRLYAPERI